MKILCDASVIRPPYSGVQLAVRHEVLSLLGLPAGLDFSVCARDRVVLDVCREHGVPTCRLPDVTQHVPARVLWQQILLPRLLQREHVELLHAFAYTAPLRCPVPYVLNVHDTIALDQPQLCSWGNARHMRSLMPTSIREAAAIVVSSRYVRDRVLDLFGEKLGAVYVVPLGVDASRFSVPDVSEPTAPQSSSRPYLLFVGNLEPKKGLPSLLAAYADVADAIGWDLVIAGRPAWRSGSLVERLARYSGPGKIVARGPISDEDLPGLYQGAAAFVFPSLTEGFGLPVLEAMASGTPVVHSDCPAVTETAGGAGLSFSRGNAAELGHALCRLAESKDLQNELREQGRRRAAEMTWQCWAEKVCRIYPEALDY
ncbi:MAG: glycosyltransferase family 4 protein [Lentisphaerae bacterium]|jgi:glycosyltransferase involved in cell wall biosynthesis|nr:glycosyltransferase family 4 protein [Lentisphaerota bacterium]MBT4816115.1 glycosyltransferase family 4 protein [Lentisphaerota bacterium]MBT5608639.1 glycosyltransferase family 4 protein [Lentisphaerota bacterium]MBT7057944.1 glycosyltransferase family 4 protein [Lentisphaerota bacterium]MBT7841609.1 glycosyltransferase family 4 protein [Lentisphaerota bacterium]